MAVRILLADDHTILREGIRGLIEARMPEAEVVGGAATGLEAIEMCAKFQPDILLLDISMPDLGGLEVLAELPNVSPKTKVAILSQYSDPGYVMRALRLGAKAYIPKKALAQDLIAAIRAVLEGRTYLDPSVAHLVVQAAINPDEGGDEDLEISGLTAREREVLKLTAEGKTAKDVAKALGISVHTANRHRANLMDKLDIHSKAELVKLAIRLKIIAI